MSNIEPRIDDRGYPKCNKDCPYHRDGPEVYCFNEEYSKYGFVIQDGFCLPALLKEDRWYHMLVQSNKINQRVLYTYEDRISSLERQLDRANADYEVQKRNTLAFLKEVEELKNKLEDVLGDINE